MRLNQFIAQASGLSRRKADAAIAESRVNVNEQPATIGQQINAQDQVTLDGKVLSLEATKTIVLNKPTGYVCSRTGQGSKTVYDLLPPELHSLKPVGRLDKNSSGLLLFTNDGQLANRLTHPSYQKQKAYKVTLNRPLSLDDQKHIQQSVELEDGPSKLGLQGAGRDWTVTMSEGRNRQIRRTFAALGYKVTRLHRTQFGPYKLSNLAQSKFELVN